MTDDVYRRFEVEDVNGQPLAFEGRELAFVSSQRVSQPKDRWLEMRIFVTRAGSYVLEVVGQTSRPDEMVKARAKVFTDPAALIESLYKTDDSETRYLTYTARELMDIAAEHDAQLREAWEAQVREVA